MKVKLPLPFATAHAKALLAIGVDVERAHAWRTKTVDVDLALLSAARLATLHTLITDNAKPRSALAVCARDIQTWQLAASAGGAKPRNCEQLAAFMVEDLRRVPGPRLYAKDEDDHWCAYYVSSVRYHPPSDRQPASASVSLVYEELGERHGETLHFSQSDCVRVSLDNLAHRGYFVETPERREEYLATTARFVSVVHTVGKQFVAVGKGYDSLDGNPGREDAWRTDTVHLDMGGRPTRVVIDVFHEEDTSHNRRGEAVNIDTRFWAKRSVNSRDVAEEADDLLDEDDEGAADAVEAADVESAAVDVPVHPICAVFDLRRHLRLRVHIENLTEYVYDANLGDSLVLPDDVRHLVDLLMVQKGDFRDVIEDKGGGAPILCAGPPGVGKTLTAEVYAEVMGRPLYSVQCSQLGLSPEALEKALLKSFTRANRWNAILLLDEADVYVRARGDDLEQNAIVGVFLRVLEYYGGVLFLTTNRSDKVDDAIISRCIARIDYLPPNQDEQRKIWRILADTAGVSLSDSTIEEITITHPDLNGRDIKNLLKLGRMFSRSEKRAISCATIDFARRFKPATDPK